MSGKIAILTMLGFIGCAQAALAEEKWQAEISKALGKTGTAMGDVYRVSLPRADLKATLGGVALKPAFALGSWLGFMPHPSPTNVTVMGDLVLTDEEVAPVMKRLMEGGIEITALHNHLLGNTPHTMYLHVQGRGEPGKLANALKDGLAQSQTPLTDGAPPAAPQKIALNIGVIDQGVGRTGKLAGEVYQFNIARREAPRADGMAIPGAMGAAISINFEPAGSGQAAITGDFVLAADEVNKVARTLADKGVTVTAIHNHMLTEEPRLFFLHFWAHGETTRLAQAMGAALKQVDVTSP